MTATTPFNYFHGDQSFEIHLDQIASLSQDHLLALAEQTYNAVVKYADALKRDPSPRNRNLFNWSTTWNNAALSRFAIIQAVDVESHCKHATRLLNMLDAASSKLERVEKQLDLAFARLNMLEDDLNDLPLHRLSSSVI